VATVKTAPLNTITEGVTDAWSTGTELVHDLGSSAVELVTGMTARKRTPWWRRQGWFALLVVAVVGVGLAIFAWQRASSTDESDTSTPREKTKGAAASTAAAG
jgi:hypothetical protein